VNWRRFLPAKREAAAAAASGVLFALSFPPVPLVVPAFLCLVPFAVAVTRMADGRGSWKQALRLGFWFGLIAYGLTLYWIAIALAIYTKLAILGFFGALLVLTPVVAAGGAALFVARRGTRLPLAILLPVVWVTVEMALMHISDLSFPWLPLGLAVARVPQLAQGAELAGVHGLSLWIALTGGLLADAWLLRANWRAVSSRLLGAGVLAVAAWQWGGYRMRTVQMSDIARIAIVQPNVPQEDKWQAQNQNRIIGMLLGLTRTAINGDSAGGDAPQLVLWPEVALPGFLPEHPDWETDVSLVSSRFHTPILFGVLDVNFPTPGRMEYFNAAMLADSTGSIRAQPPYHKRYLVPVVERVPFLDPRWFAKLRYFGGFGRGGVQAPFTLPFGKVGVLICYESIFPSVSRQYRRDGAVVIVNITNDAWFGRSLAPWQHEAHLALRAIENRVAIVRAANTGISGYVDPLGVFHGETELLTSSTRTFMAQRAEGRTLYVIAGDWIGWLSVAGTAALLAAARRRPRRAA
jgi:apolipoprotein N-acyltransferase